MAKPRNKKHVARPEKAQEVPSYRVYVKSELGDIPAYGPGLVTKNDAILLAQGLQMESYYRKVTDG